jgi:lipoprotein NlpD
MRNTHWKIFSLKTYQWLLIIISSQLIGCATKPIDSNTPTTSTTKSEITVNSKPLPPPTYEVQRGEGLYAIASRYGLDYRTVATWNEIAPPYNIYPGQILRLRPDVSVETIIPQHTNRKHHTPPQTKTDSSKQDTKIYEGALPTDHTANNWIWPTKGRVVQTFVKGKRTRQGIRIAGTAGQDVIAAESGRVIYSGDGLPGYGQLIIIKHAKNYLSAYGFNNKILVSEGTKISQGQRIAEMGYSTEGKPMLHFEIRRGETALNPMRLLPKR